MPEFVAAKTGETEAQWRQWLSQTMFQSALMIARSGVLSPTDLVVSQTTTASASVSVRAGSGNVQDTASPGTFPVVNPNSLTLDILGANPMGGLPRNDIVVFDTATGTVRNIVGTPNASPTDPTVASTQLPLARLRHAASATTVPTSVIDDLRLFTTMRGGIALVRNTTERDAMFESESLAVYRADVDTVEVCDGTNWRSLIPSSAEVAGKRIHWRTATVNIGADGYVTSPVTHGAGFTPRIVQVSYQGTTGSLFGDIVTDTYTATTFRCRMFGLDGAALAATNLPIGFVCYE